MIDTTYGHPQAAPENPWEQWSKTPVALDYPDILRDYLVSPEAEPARIQRSNEKWSLWLFRVYVWDEIPPGYVRIFSKTL